MWSIIQFHTLILSLSLNVGWLLRLAECWVLFVTKLESFSPPRQDSGFCVTGRFVKSLERAIVSRLWKLWTVTNSLETIKKTINLQFSTMLIFYILSWSNLFSDPSAVRVRSNKAAGCINGIDSLLKAIIRELWKIAP